MHLNVIKAIPCGLLVNEVVTNSFKHAFPSEKGEIKIVFKIENNFCMLEISDNGTGINKVTEESSLSIGMSLIEAFAKQLNGKYEFVYANGTKLILTFEA